MHTRIKVILCPGEKLNSDSLGFCGRTTIFVSRVHILLYILHVISGTHTALKERIWIHDTNPRGMNSNHCTNGLQVK